ncbi:MAG: hypothetical protein KTR15_03685 [Phycisphaeraceae bacterium]|nr:hypothetical protein [Phycisphaeraceae bacterium]
MHESCHHCDYDLVGLPSQGTCPECGEAYDKHSLYRAARAREPAFIRNIKWITLASFTLMILICGGVLSIRAEKPWGAIIVTLIVASVSGFGTFAYWWSERQERRASD